MPQTKDEKRRAADERLKVYDKLTLEEKLAQALMSGSNYTKQVVKLRTQLEKQESQKKRS
jgi:hypothetical protein